MIHTLVHTHPLWNGNSRGVGGFKLNDHPLGGYGYFLESHNDNY